MKLLAVLIIKEPCIRYAAAALLLNLCALFHLIIRFLL